MARRAQQETPQVVEVLRRLVDAAETYVNRSPKVKRLEPERVALLDAVGSAQLVLSVQRLPKEPRPATAPSVDVSAKKAAKLEADLERVSAELKTMHRRLRPLAEHLDTIQSSLSSAKALLDEHSSTDLPGERAA